MHSTTERVIKFSGLYHHNDVTCQKMGTRFCNLTIKDSKNVNLIVPALNQNRRKLVAFKVNWSQKRLHGHVDFGRLLQKAVVYFNHYVFFVFHFEEKHSTVDGLKQLIIIFSIIPTVKRKAESVFSTCNRQSK